jgi:hypothetical protein
MRLDSGKSHSTYVCGEAGCRFHWRMQEGYFQQMDRIMAYPTNAHQLLKPALVREHGYMYLATIEDGPPQKRTWRCAVKDCANVIVEDGKSESSS